MRQVFSYQRGKWLDLAPETYREAFLGRPMHNKQLFKQDEHKDGALRSLFKENRATADSKLTCSVRLWCQDKGRMGIHRGSGVGPLLRSAFDPKFVDGHALERAYRTWK